jgi:hypothetical protein
MRLVQQRFVRAVAVGVAMAAAAVALAEPRDSVTLTNVNSDGQGGLTGSGTPGSGSISVTGTYNVQYITLSGTLAEVNSGTFASEAVVRVFSPGGEQVAVLKPFLVAGTGGPYGVTNYVYKLATPVAATGTWSLTFSELYDDSGIDARWNTVTVTLDDGPPRVNTSTFFIFPGPRGYDTLSVCGLTSRGFTLQNQTVLAGDTRWYKVELPYPADTTGFSPFQFNGYLDIDTEGSSDTDFELGLYTEDGRLIAFDDDSGTLNQAQLTFGTATTRPAPSSGLPYDNRDGTLQAGTYYIAVGAFNTTFGERWSASSTETANRVFNLNVRTNITVSPFCQSDVNRTGATTVQDVFDFLTAFFNGC